MKHIFLLGKEGANYHNSFVYGIIYNIISNSENPDVIYYVSNLSTKKRFNPKNLRNVSFFNIKLPRLGFLTYILYDFLSLKHALKHVRQHKLDNVDIFLFSMRSGLFLPFFKDALKRANISLNIYCENDNPCCDNWTNVFKLFWNMSSIMCTKYSNCLLFSKDSTKEYFYKTFKKLDFKMTRLDFCPNVLDKPFHTFLNEHNIMPYNYYILIDDSHLLAQTSFVIEKFLKCTTKKDLVILCRKDTCSYKSLGFKYDLSKDSRIRLFNVQRFIHFIPNFTKYCYGYIHASIFGIEHTFIRTSTNINIVFDSPFNRKAELCNALYYNDKNFIDVIYNAENLKSSKSSMA